MVKTVISSEVKQLIIYAYSVDGLKFRAISEMYHVKIGSVKSIINRYKKDGQITRKNTGKPKKLSPDQINSVTDWVSEDCTRTLESLCDQVDSQFGIRVSKSTMWNYLDDLHYSFKRISPIPVRRNSEEVKVARREYALRLMEMDRYRDQIFFLDECGVAVHTRVNYGRSHRGERANLSVRAIRGKNYSVCAAMNWKSLFLYEVREGAYDTTTFIDYVKQFIEFLITEGYEKVYLVMDNVRFHHHELVQSQIADASIEIELIFLPPYSPFLNPIENLFNQLKYYVKRFRPSSADEVFHAVDLASQVISEMDCRNYYSNMMSYIGRCISMDTIEN